MLYRDEVWTGIEYQVAGHMVWEGMVTEALAICRGVHERYHPAKHNPWNEIECGDHYAAGDGQLRRVPGASAASSTTGRRGTWASPRGWRADDFRAAFTAAEGWGTISSKRDGASQTARVEVKWGKLRVKTLAVEVGEGAKVGSTEVRVGDKAIRAEAKQEGRRVVVTLAERVEVGENEMIEVRMVA